MLSLTTVAEGKKNVASAVPKVYQIQLFRLAGIASREITKLNKVGFAGGGGKWCRHTASALTEAGVKSVNPSIKVQVVDYAGSFGDAKGKQLLLHNTP